MAGGSEIAGERLRRAAFGKIAPAEKRFRAKKSSEDRRIPAEVHYEYYVLWNTFKSEFTVATRIRGGRRAGHGKPRRRA